MFVFYLSRLVCRIILVLFLFYLYLTQPGTLLALFEMQPLGPFSAAHLLWLVLAAGMVLHLLPRSPIIMAGRRQFGHYYRQANAGYDRLALLEYVQQQNRRAVRIMSIWLAAHALMGLLVLANVLGPLELFLFSLFYFLGDLVCILFFCPFQLLGTKSRCCSTCRIFNWGHFFMYTPMLFIPSFFSWSLFFLGCAVLLRGELAFAQYPERFWEQANQNLRCSNCRERTCRIKRPLYRKLHLQDKLSREEQ